MILQFLVCALSFLCVYARPVFTVLLYLMHGSAFYILDCLSALLLCTNTYPWEVILLDILLASLEYAEHCPGWWNVQQLLHLEAFVYVRPLPQLVIIISWFLSCVFSYCIKFFAIFYVFLYSSIPLAILVLVCWEHHLCSLWMLAL